MAILRVSNQGQLDSALRSAGGGDTILLSSGTYDNLTLNDRFEQKVTIASEAGNPAVINQMLLRGAANIELKGLKFDYVPGRSGDNPFWIEGGRGITLVDIDIEGKASGQYGAGVGLRVKNSQDIEILNSEVSNFRNGFAFTNSDNVRVVNNDFRGMSNDSMLLGGMTGMVIQGNDFRAMNSNPAVQHKDMIQFFTGSGSPASRDIVIRDNVIDNPEHSHAIFFTNPMANSGDRGAYYQNIVIENNDIRSAHAHGISINNGDGVTIRNNTLTQHPEGGSNTAINIPVINISTLSRDITIEGNQVASVPVPQNATWTIAGNDTGSKQFLHWYGNYGAVDRSRSAASTREAADDSPATGAPDLPTGAGTDSFRIDGGRLDGETRLAIGTLDFEQGDVIVFRNLDAGTFRAKGGANPIDVWDAGRSAKLDSALDLQEIAAFSPAVSATQTRGDLVLRIEQDDGTAEIVLEGLGAEFRAADQPDLF